MGLRSDSVDCIKRYADEDKAIFKPSVLECIHK